MTTKTFWLLVDEQSSSPEDEKGHTDKSCQRNVPATINIWKEFSISSTRQPKHLNGLSDVAQAVLRVPPDTPQ